MQAKLEVDLPLHFGAGNELFGMYQSSHTVGSKAVLLCPPLGQEQIRCHRLYRQLACALAAEGIDVLRFDYYGCGDSAGASEQVDWDRCVADTRIAAEELRLRSGAEHVVAFGARLGGSIALCAVPTAHFSEVIVWDPVLDGGVYVAEMDILQAEICEDSSRFSVPRKLAEATDQWSGFAISDRLREQLRALHPSPASVPTMVLDSLASTMPDPWRSLGIAADRVQKLEPATCWQDPGRLELAILSRPLINAVVEYFLEAA